jgi:hypothetical protein
MMVSLRAASTAAMLEYSLVERKGSEKVDAKVSGWV